MTLDIDSLRNGLTSYVHLRANEESFDQVVTKHLSPDATYRDLRFNAHHRELRVFACVAERVFFMCRKNDTIGYGELNLDNIVAEPDDTFSALTTGTTSPYLPRERVDELYVHLFERDRHKYPVRINVDGDLMYVSKVEYWCVHDTRLNVPKALHMVYFLDRVNADLETDDKDATMSDANDQDKPETHSQRLPVEDLREYRGVCLLERIGATTTQEFEDELQGIFNLCQSGEVMCKFYDYDGWPLHCVRRKADFDADGDIAEYTFVMKRCHANQPPEWFDIRDLKEQIIRCYERSQEEDVEFRFEISNREHRMNKLHILYMYYEDDNPEYIQDEEPGDRRLLANNVLKFVLTE
jgi:hypothetical protein